MTLSGPIDPAAAMAPATLQAARLRDGDAASIREGALRFEGALLRQMLRELRDGSLAPEASSVTRGYRELLDDQVVQAMVKAGGLGLGRSLAEQLISQVGAAAALTGSTDSSVTP